MALIVPEHEAYRQLNGICWKDCLIGPYLNAKAKMLAVDQQRFVGHTAKNPALLIGSFDDSGEMVEILEV